MTLEQFRTTHWSYASAFASGRADRFREFLTWSAFNQLLASHWREPYRYRLAHRGRDFDVTEYTQEGPFGPQIQSSDVTDLLRQGATLSFDGADEVHRPLTVLTEAFEAVFRCSAQINVYAAWREARGLDVHRDDQEVFVLQVEGRKRWVLYGNDADPLNRQIGETNVSSGAMFDEVLAPGDMLYIPKGCYHLALPQNEPVLHITLGLLSGRTTMKRRPSFSLPWSAQREGLPADLDFVLRLRAPMAVISVAPDSLEVQWAGTAYQFPATMEPLLRALERETIPVTRLIELLSDRLDGDTVRLFVELLVRKNLLELSA